MAAEKETPPAIIPTQCVLNVKINVEHISDMQHSKDGVKPWHAGTDSPSKGMPGDGGVVPPIPPSFPQHAA